MVCDCGLGAAFCLFLGSRPKTRRFTLAFQPPNTESTLEAVTGYLNGFSITSLTSENLLGNIGRRSSTSVAEGLSPNLGSIDRHRTQYLLTLWQARGEKFRITDFYTEQRSLGAGAFGEVSVWRSKHVIPDSSEEGGEEFAVKKISWMTIYGGCARDKKHEELLRKELSVLIRLDNPFIVRVKEWYETPWYFYFVMELCTGGSLQDKLDHICTLDSRAQRMAHEPHLRRFFKQSTYALAYLHGFQPPIVHMDLKPDNILLKSDREDTCVKLIDFGLTVGHGDKHDPAGLLDFERGTLDFMAPQLFFPQSREIGYASHMDVWSLGIILCRIATALESSSVQHPLLPLLDYDELSSVKLFYAFKEMRDGELQWDRTIFGQQCPSLVDLADKLLVFDPDERIKAAEILDHPWVAADDPAKALDLTTLEHRCVIENMLTYCELSTFDRAILRLVADGISAQVGPTHTQEVVKYLRRVFRAADTERDGTLSMDELREVFMSTGVTISEHDMGDLFSNLDTGGEGAVNWTEFLAACIGGGVLCSKEGINAAFRALDTNGSGVITAEELCSVVGEEEATRFLADNNIERIEYTYFQQIVQHVANKRLMYKFSAVQSEPKTS
eukprot:TRINITY_DN9054_c0_g1_i1.p1 TRINITY_DN9054_c0_g1~~TRINITY_DN9054_c0_g1_i1.p1  ORF type:complete len:614 (-),score=104.46 TRINITY_DN9054_c0_g1_i1:84-1925(-)